ncbi:deoxyribose-phosphate aldolase [Thalassobaculum sp.]|uniref:deoxyribose-phosphate aldolase n=1 Tax=Thalassobaculum sp. TaxID=2022740 RepID=UPI0032EEE7A9
MTPDTLRAAAARAIACLDLTSLNDDDTDAIIAELCARAVTPAGPVAAVCVYAPFVAQCRRALEGSGVKICTVVNFPHGREDAASVAVETRAAVADGADEIDVVLPYQAWLSGRHAAARAVLDAAREATGDRTLKVILETGRLMTTGAIVSAATVAIEAGADFLKTSTGKTPVAATLESAHLLLDCAVGAGRPVGVKVAGGVRNTAQDAAYLRLADRVLGGTATPDRFRFGASGLLRDLLTTLGQSAAGPAARSGY